MLLLLAGWLWTANGIAYEVWMGTSCTPASAALFPNAWSNTAAQMTGINANPAPCLPTAGTPCENETRCGTREWQTVFRQFRARDNAMVGIPRSAVAFRGPLTNAIEDQFKKAATYGYGIRNLMFYDNRVGENSYKWTKAEVQRMRDYLNATGRANVGLMFDARNDSAGVRAWCANALVDDIVLEANAKMWFSNAGRRQQLLQWLWTNPATANKRIIFQIPPAPDPYGPTNNFMSVRRLLCWLGNDQMGWNFMRSSRVIFMPVTYNTPTMTFYPETAAPDRYTNTMTSLVLSMIEQRNMFEGRTRIPTLADADSMARNIPPPLAVSRQK